jgi:hypothetical protein
MPLLAASRPRAIHALSGPPKAWNCRVGAQNTPSSAWIHAWLCQEPVKMIPSFNMNNTPFTICLTYISYRRSRNSLQGLILICIKHSLVKAAVSDYPFSQAGKARTAADRSPRVSAVAARLAWTPTWLQHHEHHEQQWQQRGKQVLSRKQHITLTC